MTTETIELTAEAQIRARLDDWAKATRAKHIEGIMASYAPDILSFDCHSQLQLKARRLTGSTWKPVCPAYRAR